jgi:hypothetical protein
MVIISHDCRVRLRHNGFVNCRIIRLPVIPSARCAAFLFAITARAPNCRRFGAIVDAAGRQLSVSGCAHDAGACGPFVRIEAAENGRGAAAWEDQLDETDRLIWRDAVLEISAAPTLPDSNRGLADRSSGYLAGPEDVSSLSMKDSQFERSLRPLSSRLRRSAYASRRLGFDRGRRRSTRISRA